MEMELIIQNGKNLYSPAVEEGVEWSTERSGAPGQLEFKVIADCFRFFFKDWKSGKYRVSDTIQGGR